MSRSEPTSYFVRALAAVAGASAVHLALSHVLLAPLAGSAGRLVPGAREAVYIVVGVTAVALLGTFYLRTQYSDADHLTRSIPTTLRVAPPVCAALLIPLAYPTSVLEGPVLGLIAAVAPVVVATWASAIIISLSAKRVLHSLAVRSQPLPAEGVLREFARPSLAGSYVRVLAGSTFAASLLVIGAVLARGDLLPQLGWSLRTVLPLCGLLVMVVIAGAAGASLGQSPGRDVMSIARRLDALGYNTRETMAWPVVVTSSDEVGELLAHLETLRLRLARELTLYQDALDKTKRADATKAQFLNAVSHELRTPLNSVCGFAQLLLEEESGRLSEAQSEDVRLIRSGGQQLLELINDILDISMIESGELRLAFSRSGIGTLIEEVVRIHQSLVRDKGVQLKAEVGPDLPTIICDRRRIGQILTNLVSNAIKFTEEGSIRVRAALDPRQNCVVIRVIDTGIGIAADELGGVFEEYRQAGSAMRRKKGAGLGLAIARSIAAHHGGSLTAESIPGHGSTFTLTLPFDPPRRPSSIDMAEEAARAAERAKRRTGETPAQV